MDAVHMDTVKRWVTSCIPAEILALLGALVAWQVIVTVFRVPPYLFPGLNVVLREIALQPEFYFAQSLYTLGNTLIAFILSVVIGLVLAIAIVYSRFLEKTLFAVLIAFNSVPKVALAPLFVIWLGTGNPSKIGMAFMISLFAIVIDSVLGLRSLHPDVVDLGRALRGSGLKMLLKLRLPNALPSIFSGMKVAMSLSLVGVIVGEFIAATQGLGFVVLSAQGMFRTDRVFAAVFLLAVIGTALFYMMEYLERKLIPWHESHRGRHTGARSVGLSPTIPTP